MSKIYAELSLKSTSFAFKDIETEDKDWEKHIFDEDNYTFISIIGLRDEIRHDAEKCIQSLKDTHVDVKMITGDTRITAVNVSKQLKLIDLDLAQDEIQR